VSSPRPAGSVQMMLLAVGAVASQAAVLTALLYYFGWARADATAHYFGLDVGLLGYTTADFLLHSLNSALPPLIVGVLVITSAVALHRTMVLPRASQIHPRALLAARTVGIALAGLVGVGVIFPRGVGIPLGVLLPLALVGGALLIAYEAHLSALRASTSVGPEIVVLLGLAVVGALWALGLHAQRVGQERAEATAFNLHNGAEVVLYSAQRLAVAGRGVTVTEITTPDSAYRFRYGGLRLLVSTAEVDVLLPSGWRKGEGSAFLIPDLDGVRLDVIAPP
jgi:uncharacterized integral membrane protein